MNSFPSIKERSLRRAGFIAVFLCVQIEGRLNLRVPQDSLYGLWIGLRLVHQMQGWLEREIADVTRAAGLRIKDATKFVNAYALGEISADEAAERSYQYSNRWGDALPGVARSAALSDEEILKKIDDARDPSFVGRLIQRPPGIVPQERWLRKALESCRDIR